MPKQPRKMTRYRDETRELYAAVTHWGSGRYRTFYRDLNNVEHPLVESALPPRSSMAEAQADLDKFAQMKNLKSVK